jgi:hypothetical protein
MFKKYVLPAVIIATMLIFNPAVDADPGKSMAKKLDVTSFQLTKNLHGTKTFERNQVISGRAENGSEITMTLYWFKTEEDKSILSKKKSSEETSVTGEWVEQGKFTWEVGASEIFAKPITLNPGKNRIYILVKDTKGNTKEETIDVEFVQKNELAEFINSYVMKNLKKKAE